MALGTKPLIIPGRAGIKSPLLFKYDNQSCSVIAAAEFDGIFSPLRLAA